MNCYITEDLYRVSIQLESPASEDNRNVSDDKAINRFLVSIQLESPASEDLPSSMDPIRATEFPFNWNPQRVRTPFLTVLSTLS